MKHEIIIYEDARGRAPLREYLKKLKSQKDDDSRIRIGKIQDYISLLQEKGTYSSHGLVARSFCCMHSKRKARKRPTQNFAERNANTKTG